jgi:hypothetical protein
MLEFDIKYILYCEISGSNGVMKLTALALLIEAVLTSETSVYFNKPTRLPNDGL